MVAKNSNGEPYEYVFEDGGSGVFHHSRACAGRDTYDSDMTEGAAVRATIDGEMRPCGNCCVDFPIRVHGTDTKSVGITPNVEIEIPAQRIEVVKDRCDLSDGVLQALDDAGFHE